MVGSSWSIHDMGTDGKRTAHRWAVVLPLLLTVASVLSLGADNPLISIGFSLDLPQMTGLTGAVAVCWADSEMRLEFSRHAGQTLPNLSFESTLRRGRVDLRGRMEGLLTSPFFAAGFGVQGDQTDIHFDARFALSSGRLSLDAQHIKVVLSPLAGAQLGGRLTLSDAGVSLSALDASAQTGLVNVAYRAVWDEARNTSRAYSVEIPSLRLGLERLIRSAEAGTEAITSWYPILPSGSEHAVVSEDPLAGIQPAITLQEGRTSQLRDSDCSACGLATRADSSEDTVDFGEVMVGELARAGITLNCQYHVFCWLDEITVRPHMPFEVSYAPVRILIPLGGRRDIELEFAPTSVGRFTQTITLRYCFATWHEDEEIYGDMPLGDVEGHYTYQCTTVALQLTGVALAKPEARATYSPDRPICGRDVQFYGSGSFDPNPEGAITAYEWDFGDGSIATEINPTHRFSSSGTYRVRLKAWNNREMASDPYAFDIDVAPDLIEVAGVAGAAAAAGLAVHSIGLAPPLLAVAVPGAALAVASIVHQLGSARFPIDQLIVRFPQSWDETDVQQLVERNVPGARVIGYFSSLHTFLIQFPIATGSPSQAAAELDAVENASPEFSRTGPSSARTTWERSRGRSSRCRRDGYAIWNRSPPIFA